MTQRQVDVQSRTPPWLGGGFALIVLLFAIILIRWPDNFFADDSYFYFQVAWNIARGLGSTFNNVVPTNGYLPLWMLLCVVVFKIVSGKAAAVHAIGFLISALNAGAVWLLCRLLGRTAPGMWWAALCLYVPFSFLGQLGTEGALSGFVLASLALCAFRLLQSPEARNGFAFALCGSLAVLSRLDSIFVVALTFLGMFFAGQQESRRKRQRVMFLCMPVYAVLWGAYLASNELWFGTLQPISGMLKSVKDADAKHFGLPHTAVVALAIIVPCALLLAWFRRDEFFKAFEAPFAAGVVIHAFYIRLVMSSETRWTWYYTSWILLAGILLSRVLWVAFGARPRVLRSTLGWASLLALSVGWYVLDLQDKAHPIPDARGEGFQQQMSDKAHLHTVLAFDKPGRMAYYSAVQVVALDGLMGDLTFQHDLASRGIAEFDTVHHVDGFVGPPQPMNAWQKGEFCDQIYLSAVRFTCVPVSRERWGVSKVEVFARLSGTSGGTIALAPENIVGTPGETTVWRIP